MPSLTRPSSLKVSSAAKHRGRAKTRYSFELSALRLESGLPSMLSATGLIVQCSRGPKISSTKEVELTAETKEACGNVSWDRQTLSFVATLFASKTGKATGFSDKRYKVAVLTVKPNFGTSKRVLKELASADINISDYVQTDEPQSIKLRLDRRSNDGMPVILELKIRARALKAGEAGGDDDDDDESISSALTGFSSLHPDERGGVAASHGEPDALEQDLDGFSESLAAAGSAMFKKSVRPPDDAAGASPFGTPVPKPADRNPFGTDSPNPFGASSSRPQVSEAEQTAAAAFDDDEEKETEAHAPGSGARASAAALPTDAASAATRLAPAPNPPTSLLTTGPRAVTPPPIGTSSSEVLALREELSYVRNQLSHAQEEARAAKAIADDRKRRLASEQEERDAERERLRAELKVVTEERDSAAAKADGFAAELAAVRKASEAEAEARKARDRAKSAEYRKNDQTAIDAAVAAATAATSAASAGQLASLRSELAAAQKQASKAQAQAKEMMHEIDELREELQSTAEQVGALRASHRVSDDRPSRSASTDGERNNEEAIDQLSTALIEAKLAAAQYAFERDEARQKAKALREDIQGVQGSGKKLAERATRFEVKYEALREQYDTDLASLIELRLVAAETQAKLAEYEAKARGAEVDLT